MSGRTTLPLELAGIRLDVTLGPALGPGREELLRRLEPYRRPALTAEVALEVRAFATNEVAPTTATAIATVRDGRAVVSGRWTHLEMNGAGDAWARVAPNAPAPVLENPLRILLSRLLLARGGAMLHAGGLHERGVGVAFPGASGVGKSTLVLRQPRASWIGEDLVAVVRRGERFVLESLPFLSSRRVEMPRARAPLAAFAFPRAAPRLALRRLTRNEARPRLVRAVVAFGCEGLEAAALDVVVALSARSEAFELEVDLTSDPWVALSPELGCEPLAGAVA